jgi:hypothetical protein
MFTHDVAGTAPVEAQLPAALPVSEGPPVEDVLMVRDEAANMVWGIERTVWLGTGTPMPGEEAARETLAYRVRLHPQADGLEPVAAIAYEAMNTVPENGLDAGEPYQVPRGGGAAGRHAVDVGVPPDARCRRPAGDLARHPPRHRPR